MNSNTFDSADEFKKAFNSGLVQLLSTNQSAGTFILVLANFIQHPLLYKENQSLLSDAYFQLFSHYQEVHNSGMDIEGATDDINVLKSIFDIGLENMKHSAVRYFDKGDWSVYFNHLRSFRPERMSSQKVKSINVEYDNKSFNFNKPFLKKEIFIQQVLNKKKVSLLYNKFPFADYHGLLVIDREKEYNQYLSEDIFYYTWDLYSNLKESIENLVISYNSLGAGASVNHLHFQTCIIDRALSISSEIWTHNGGDNKYPAECVVFNTVMEAWHFINDLQLKNTAFNLIFTGEYLYCLPRKLEIVKNKFIPQIGWFEMAGSFSLADEENYFSLEESQIKDALREVSQV